MVYCGEVGMLMLISQMALPAICIIPAPASMSMAHTQRNIE
jgi:hypothetical protein